MQIKTKRKKNRVRLQWCHDGWAVVSASNICGNGDEVEW